ncbi:uncharacterized protein LOC108049846 [Drosophila rhopaloa]|uniref:Uncharacterized protein LOC108049846 n=1 Tax=Drosophila rhopaloa TaxID=1041015 RepID=A0A6P4F8C5_DRORH|nr:uncharacterized protein LOC108049846 [Drosophila rhopaloa]
MESAEGEGERPSTSGGLGKDSGTGIGISAILGYAQSEYSLDTTSGAMMANRRHLESENDGNATDEEVEICITRLNFLPDRGRRLYMDCQLSLPAGGSVPMRGGAEIIAVPTLKGSSSPEVLYERNRNLAAEQKEHWRLQKMAFPCPLGNCDVVVNPGNLLSHCLMYHQEIITLEAKTREAKCVKVFGKSLLESRATKSHCVGLLIFESGKQVALNANLPRIYADWEGRLPVFVMLWKTSWDSMPAGPRITHLYILWLFCPQAQPPLMVTVETDESLDGVPRHQMIHTCPSSEILEQCDLLCDSPLFMRFTHREMKELTEDYTKDIGMQFTVRENELERESNGDASSQGDLHNPPEIELITAVEELENMNEENSKEEFSVEKAEDTNEYTDKSN